MIFRVSDNMLFLNIRFDETSVLSILVKDNDEFFHRIQYSSRIKLNTIKDTIQNMRARNIDHNEDFFKSRFVWQVEIGLADLITPKLVLLTYIRQLYSQIHNHRRNKSSRGNRIKKSNELLVPGKRKLFEPGVWSTIRSKFSDIELSLKIWWKFLRFVVKGKIRI